ncbi:electron transfer flavoprotein subunit beta/FixA family protein [Dethiosulfatarculus sandiegensis]|uniref:Electron transfer flavoprotein subunit beta n=1 Tax=Dethiosulfatarculus sandiegensis TaxID=1429043 RepID=A0A0D2HVR6_9BACT|nr:electron transfer flavoprotein subunit beta/FixA family protein [Dethiosulfatarculus sandiegensis]KIX14483.1 electron transfer flavoprotein subunit beta [Dethiosulfatarculus sandiegensis]
MDILVCAKHVPETAEAELELIPEEVSLDLEDLVFDINEWDLYAVEAALKLTEEHGGSVTVLSLGDEEAEDTLRRAMAMGCEKGILIDDEDLIPGDGHTTADILSRAAKKGSYDLVLCGVQASDDGLAWTGPALACKLGLNFTTMVTSILKQGSELKVKRELEGGMEEELTLPLPCLLTIQTGINEPRYVSVMGIRKVRKKPLEVLDGDDLGLEGLEDAGEGLRLETIGLNQPVVKGEVDLIEGSPQEQAQVLVDLLAQKGGLK